MTDEEYFVLRCNEDGIGIEHFESAEKLKEYVKERIEDHIIFLNKIPHIERGYFCYDKQEEEDDQYLIIIKGKIIVPKPIEVIREYDIE